MKLVTWLVYISSYTLHQNVNQIRLSGHVQTMHWELTALPPDPLAGWPTSKGRGGDRKGRGGEREGQICEIGHFQNVSPYRILVG